MEIKEISLKNGVALGIKVELPNAPFLMIKGDKGFIMCGYLDIKAAEKLKDVAAKIKGVSDFVDILDGEITDVTTEAEKLGILKGMKGREALEKLVGK